MENNLPAYYFHQGTNFRSYEHLGCSLEITNGKFVYTFRTWAPKAQSVSLVSDFTDWNYGISFEKITNGGIWECVFISDKSLEKEPYKFRITSDKGIFLKGDPYARFSRGKDDGASLIWCEDQFQWSDKSWFNSRKNRICSKDGEYLSCPINIYEVHAGSFVRHEDNSYYTYRELADTLIPYLKFMGYTHVEFLPLAEYPFDGSWGYQVCGFYATTSRFGTPQDFKYMINSFHSNGIGVILDWVPAHFPKDEWGLFEFDGYCEYEYQGYDRQESRSWGTRFFDLGREEVQSFLISNALYFLNEFHIDGLRVDAVASMLYLDYDREPGEWIPNIHGGNKNLEAVAFIQKLNKAVFAEHPDVLMIAEESTAFGGITKPTYEGGLGFNLKWNMGLANDLYEYVMTNPINRSSKHSALTFPLMYAFSENYVLTISHDEVVHGKLSFIDKMFGEYGDKFRQARVTLMLFMTYPGKKMLFMGTEYAQFREWDFENSLEWFMLDYPIHREFRNYVASLNRFYLSRKELWEIDFSEKGFGWLLPNEKDKNTVAFRRYGINGESLIVILNFSGVNQNVTIPVNKKNIKTLFSSEYGYEAENHYSLIKTFDGYLLDIEIPSFCGIILKETNKTNKIKSKE